MAQLGCFVPARHATIPLRDRFLSRIGSGDDIEHNMSTFATEMKEASYILHNVTPASLVIIDELGRGTSNIDGMFLLYWWWSDFLGVSLAFAIAESLLQSGAFTLFVTHYPLVTSLPNLYPNVKNFHLKTSFTAGATAAPAPQSTQSATDMVYLHSIAAGPSDLQLGYGILMAEKCGFSQEIIADARAIQSTVKEVYPTLCSQESSSCNEDQRAVALYALLQHLQLLKDTQLDDKDLRVYLSNLRSKVSDEAVEQLLQYLDENDKNNT